MEKNQHELNNTQGSVLSPTPFDSTNIVDPDIYLFIDDTKIVRVITEVIVGGL